MTRKADKIREDVMAYIATFERNKGRKPAIIRIGRKEYAILQNDMPHGVQIDGIRIEPYG